MNKIHTFFTIDPKYPVRQIRTYDMSVRVCGKTSWAIGRHKSYLIGSTAFYTLKAAERSKFGHIEKRLGTQSGWLMRNKPETYSKMLKEYHKYKAYGTFEHE